MDPHPKMVERPMIKWGRFTLVLCVAMLAALTILARCQHSATGLDQRVLREVVGARGTALVDVARIVTYGGNFLVLLGAATVAALVLRRRVSTLAAMLPASALLFASGISQLEKSWIGRDRPPFAFGVVHASGWSFPSGHATNAASFFTSLVLVVVVGMGSTRRRRVSVVAGAGVVVLFVGMSRVVLGVHWPSDVIAGWSLGAAVAMVVVLSGIRWHIWVPDRVVSLPGAPSD